MATLRASAKVEAGTAGATTDASTSGNRQYGYKPSAMKLSGPGGFAEPTTRTLLVALIIEILAYSALRYLFRTVHGG